MQNIEKKCANCGAQLKKIGLRRFKCEYCEMMYLLTNKELKAQALQKPEKKDIIVGQGCAGIMVAFVLLMFAGTLGTLVIGGLYEGGKAIFGKKESQIQVVYEEEVSEGFIDFAQQIFRKKYEDLTRADWANVTGLYMRDTDGVQYGYCTVNGENVPFQLECYYAQVLKFAYKFPNLAVLDSEVELYGEYLEGLENLTHVTCENSVGFLAEILPCPEKITSLCGVDIGLDEQAFDKFPNLKVLEGFVDSTDDLSVLRGLTQLEELTLECYEPVRDGSAIGNLTNLKKLDIYTRSMQNLDFLYELDNLSEFTINSGYELESIEPIASLTGLKKLHFEYYYGPKDWKIIESMAQLEELWICHDIQKDMDLSKFTNLKSLSVVSADEFDAAVLEYFPKLEKIYLEEVDKVVNGDMLFGGDNLKEITLYDCGIWTDLEQVETNASVENLSIKYCRFGKLVDGYAGGQGKIEEVNFKDYIDVFARFPSLKELTIRGMRLESLDFALNLKDLQVLDVISNNVMDISVLAGCKNLRELWCGDNALVGEIKLDGVFVFTVSESDSWYRYEY